MAELIVVTGPPGAGKSTVARSLVGEFEPSALVAGDQFFAFLERGYLDPWTSAARQQNETVISAAAAAAGRLVVGGLTVVFDGVLGPWFLDTFVAASGLASLNYVILLPAEHEVLERVRSRIGHGFTNLAAARHMYEQFARAEVDERHLLSGSATADDTAAAIVERVRDGSLRVVAG